MKNLVPSITLVSVLILLILNPICGQEVDMGLFHGMTPRSIGPAGMSGRVTAIDVNLSNPDQIFIGTAAGGVWKSENSGHTWLPLFDDQPAVSIGDVEIYQKNPNIIYVATGEGNPRNSQNSGLGMFKTIDGGRTWQHLGLELTRQIHRIILHPDNPDQLVIGVSGASWGDSAQRGIYKSVDGGESWEKVLYINDRTGVADLVVDPSNPNRMLAAMWEHRRWPWFFKSGGEGSGLYLSTDGGDHWKQLSDEDGLPKGELGRMGLSFAPSDPSLVYAYIESDDNAIFASEDGGETWERRSKPKDRLIGDRPFYYADIYVDSKNENRIYSIASTVTVSQDGGRSWQTFAPGNRIHTDHHAFWMHPDDNDYLIIGHDGGLNITHDRGANWWFTDNLPLGQFYHMRVDNEIPYNVMGGLQDNGSWLGPSQTWFKGGIRNMYWQRLSVGDGFDVVPDPLDSDYGYAMGQAGNLVRYHRPSGQLYKIKPVHPEGVYLRFNWNAGIAISPVDNKTIYYGSQYVHKSEDNGSSWEIISPDLTTNDTSKQKFLESGGLTYDVTGAEFHTTIITIDPSPLDANILWVGTDDGNVQLTRDGGNSWQNVAQNIRGIPDASWITQVTASPYSPSEAVIVIDDHRRNNWSPFVFRTKDFGATWTNIADHDAINGYAYCFIQDPIEPNLQFIGTEFGLYVSFDGGVEWNEWTEGYPTVPTTDLAIHPREYDLVIATFGRSFWILDDIRPLREMASIGSNALLDKPVHLFSSPPAYLMIIGESKGYRHGKIGDALYNGENRPFGALISYYIKEGKTEDVKEVKITINDDQGRAVRTFYHPVKGGVNRVVWDLRQDAPRSPMIPKPKDDYRPGPGFYVGPGIYELSIVYGEEEHSTSIEVIGDPRLDFGIEDVSRKQDMYSAYNRLIEKGTEAMDKVRSFRKSASLTTDLLKMTDVSKEDTIYIQIDTLSNHLDQIDHLLRGKQVQGIYRDPEAVLSQIFFTGYLMDHSLTPVTLNQQNQLRLMKESIDSFEKTVNQIEQNYVQPITSSIDRLDLNTFRLDPD